MAAQGALNPDTVLSFGLPSFVFAFASLHSALCVSLLVLCALPVQLYRSDCLSLGPCISPSCLVLYPKSV